MVSGRVSRQEHGIEKVHPIDDIGTVPVTLGASRAIIWSFKGEGLEGGKKKRKKLQ